MNWLAERYQVDTDPLRTERRVEFVLLVCAGLFLLQLIWGLFRAIVPATPSPVLPTAESMVVAPVAGTVVPSPEQRDEIRRRPVFWASREPLQPEPVQVTEADQALAAQQKQEAGAIKGVKLAGVFGDGEDAGIIVIGKDKKRRLMVGDKIDGWTLESVDPVEARFSRGVTEARLELKRGKLKFTEVSGNAGEADSATNNSGAPAPDKPGDQAPAKAAKKKPVAKQQVPEGLGLGGGDRNRGKTTK